jgi:hypothetical protein
MSISSGIITNFGNQVVCEHLYKNSTDYVLYIAIGTGTTTPTVYDFIMEAEYARALATVSSTALRLYLSLEFAITEDVVITECGVFDALIGGNLVYHGVTGDACKRTMEDEDTYTVGVVLTPVTG